MSEGAPAITHSARDQWLMRRRDYITASDAAAILGIHPTRVPGDVFMEKLGLSETAESAPLLWGQDLQDGVGRGYARATGRPVRMESLEVPELTVHPDLSWLACTLDAETEGCDRTPVPVDCEGTGVLETKATENLNGRWSEDESGNVETPAEFEVQVQVQAACKGRSWGSLTGFVSMLRPPLWKDIRFDRELFDLMVPKLDEFRGYVARRQAPDDPAFYSLEVVKKLYQVDDGAQVMLKSEAVELVQEWEALCEARLANKKHEDEVAKRLRILMGAATVGVLPDGTWLTLNTTAGGWVERFYRDPSRRLNHTKNNPAKKKGKK